MFHPVDPRALKTLQSHSMQQTCESFYATCNSKCYKSLFAMSVGLSNTSTAIAVITSQLFPILWNIMHFCLRSLRRSLSFVFSWNSKVSVRPRFSKKWWTYLIWWQFFFHIKTVTDFRWWWSSCYCDVYFFFHIAQSYYSVFKKKKKEEVLKLRNVESVGTADLNT